MKNLKGQASGLESVCLKLTARLFEKLVEYDFMLLFTT